MLVSLPFELRESFRHTVNQAAAAANRDQIETLLSRSETRGRQAIFIFFKILPPSARHVPEIGDGGCERWPALATVGHGVADD